VGCSQKGLEITVLSVFDILLVKTQYSFNMGNEIRKKKKKASEFGSGLSNRIKKWEEPGCHP
jgi:hypothetical protein